MPKYNWGEKSKNTTFKKTLNKTNTMIDDSIINDMYLDYLSGMPMKTVGEKYGKSAGSICNLFKRRGLETRGSGVRKHFVNEDFFENVDSEYKAYILGFISADGHVSEKTLNFKTSSYDIDILEKINSAMESDYPIKGDKYLTLSIFSPKIANDLRNYGLDRRKTWDMPKEINLPDELIRHYLRGLIDGDGSVTIFYHKRENKNKLCIALSGGDEQFLALCDSIISSNIECNTKKIQKTKKNWGTSYLIKWHDKQALKLNEWLYKDSNIYLERKYKNGEKFFGKKSNKLE